MLDFVLKRHFLLKVLCIFPFSSKNTIKKFFGLLIASTDTISASADSLIVLMDILIMSLFSWVRFSEFLFCFWISNDYRGRKVRYNLTLLFSPNEYKAPLLLKPNRPVRFALYPRSSVKEKEHKLPCRSLCSWFIVCYNVCVD